MAFPRLSDGFAPSLMGGRVPTHGTTKTISYVSKAAKTPVAIAAIKRANENADAIHQLPVAASRGRRVADVPSAVTGMVTSSKTPDHTGLSLDDVNTMTQRMHQERGGREMSRESREQTRGEVGSWQ